MSESTTFDSAGARAMQGPYPGAIRMQVVDFVEAGGSPVRNVSSTSSMQATNQFDREML